MLAGAAPVLTEEDGEHLGLLAGMLTPEQTAALLSQRDDEHRPRRGPLPPCRTTSSADWATTTADSAAAAAPEALTRLRGASSPTRGRPAGAAAAELRREVNQLVARVASRSGEPHARVHVALRKAVPGPASASASVEVLEKRRDFLLAQL
ncbi:MAG: hypothetical protein PGN11_00470 [Quadrisphaera sp.]